MLVLLVRQQYGCDSIRALLELVIDRPHYAMSAYGPFAFSQHYIHGKQRTAAARETTRTKAGLHPPPPIHSTPSLVTRHMNPRRFIDRALVRRGAREERARRMAAIGKTRWGQAWLGALRQVDHENRLGRGLELARQGAVEGLHFAAPGEVRAEVRGSQPAPYRVQLSLKPFTPEQTRALLAEVARRPDWLDLLLDGQLPPGYRAGFGASRGRTLPAQLARPRHAVHLPRRGCALQAPRGPPVPTRRRLRRRSVAALRRARAHARHPPRGPLPTRRPRGHTATRPAHGAPIRRAPTCQHCDRAPCGECTRAGSRAPIRRGSARPRCAPPRSKLHPRSRRRLSSTPGPCSCPRARPSSERATSPNTT